MWLGVWMHDYRLAVLTRWSRCAARGPDPLAGCAATAAREAMACASEEGAVGCRAASEAAWCHSGRWEGMDGEARGATRRPSLALPLFFVALSSLVLPSTAQMVAIPQQYTNVSRILSIDPGHHMERCRL